MAHIDVPFRSDDGPHRLVTEDERTLIGARDKFRRVTQGALDRFREKALDGQSDLSDSATALLYQCRLAAYEYRKVAENLKE